MAHNETSNLSKPQRRLAQEAEPQEAQTLKNLHGSDDVASSYRNRSLHRQVSCHPQTISANFKLCTSTMYSFQLADVFSKKLFLPATAWQSLTKRYSVGRQDITGVEVCCRTFLREIFSHPDLHSDYCKFAGIDRTNRQAIGSVELAWFHPLAA